MRKSFFAFLFCTAIAIAGCGGINYSQLSPEADNFHPTSIAIFPATVGEHEAARGIVETVLSKKMVEGDLFENVVDSMTIKTRLKSSTVFANDMQAYIQKLNALGVSDPTIVAQLQDTLKTDAFFLTYITSWGYGRLEGNKVAKVELAGPYVNKPRANSPRR